MAEAKPEKSSTKSSSTETKKGSSMDVKTVGRYLFLAGIVLAVIIGIVPAQNISEWVVWLMIIIALVGGWIFIPQGEETEFILITLAVLFFSQLLGDLPPSLATPVMGTLAELGNFLGVAVLAVALRTVISWFTAA
jgi:hypothetical protein